MGGIPVGSKKSTGKSLTDQIIEDFKNRKYLNLAVTPEGTRSYTETWRTGFLYIAYGAQVPIQLGVIDFSNKKIIIKEEYTPTQDIEKDMKFIKNFYSQYPQAGKYPEKFSTKI